MCPAMWTCQAKRSPRAGRGGSTCCWRAPRALAVEPGAAGHALVIIAGAGLTVYSGYIHLYLWGRQPYPYSAIPTIGPLFLLQGIVGILLGVLVVVTRRLFAVLLAAGFLVVSAAALVIDVEVGMFGFQDSWSVPYATEHALLRDRRRGAAADRRGRARLARRSRPGPGAAGSSAGTARR